MSSTDCWWLREALLFSHVTSTQRPKVAASDLIITATFRPQETEESREPHWKTVCTISLTFLWPEL